MWCHSGSWQCSDYSYSIRQILDTSLLPSLQLSLLISLRISASLQAYGCAQLQGAQAMLPMSHSSLHQCIEQLQENYSASKGSRVSIGDTFRACVGSCRSLFRLKPVHSDNTHDWTAPEPLQHPAVSWLSAITGYTQGVLVAPWPAPFEADHEAVAAQREQLQERVLLMPLLNQHRWRRQF